MSGALVTMSTKELTRLEIIQKVVDHRLTQTMAATQLQLSLRQIKRLTKAYRLHGAEGLISKRRGLPGNRHAPALHKQLALVLLKQHYPDFSPTFAAEKLAENHELYFSKETIRQWMIEIDLWIPRDKRLKRAYQPRNRRACYGELIQIDGSPHAWFEGRAPKCTLLVYVDDATSHIMEAYFAETESTFTYFQATQSYLAKHGKPVAFYSDKHSVFRINNKEAKGGAGVTQFGRALHDLNIDIICANTPQAKGRVERANRTLQDRLVKELRLRAISTIEEANIYIAEFIEAHNQRFGRPPLSEHNAHRLLSAHEDLNEIFSWQEGRTLSNNLTLQYDKVMYLIEDSIETRKLAKKRVTIFDFPNGSIKIKHEDKELPYSIFDKIRRVDQGQIVENKRLGNALKFIKEKQDERDEKRSTKCPSRVHLGKSSTTELRTSTVTHR